MDPTEVANRFAYHKPPHGGIESARATVRHTVAHAAEVFVEMLPDGREKSLAVTHLEEAMMWANKAIACDPLGVGEAYQQTEAQAPQGGAELQ